MRDTLKDLIFRKTEKKNGVVTMRNFWNLQHILVYVYKKFVQGTKYNIYNTYNSSQPSKFNIPRCLTFYLYFFFVVMGT